METSLAPGFLVAAPMLQDPNFSHSLVLLVAHGEDGALGLVINRSEAVGCVGELLGQLGLRGSQATHPEPLRIGGPVAPEMGWVLFQPQGAPETELEIRLSAEVAVSPSREVLDSIANEAGPQRYTIFLGHAGWAPGQLEEEVRIGAWLPVALDPELVWDVPIAERWQAAFARAGVSAAGFMTGQRGSS